MGISVNVTYFHDVCTSKRVPASAVADEPIALISRLGRSSVAESGNCRARAIPTTDSQSYPRQVQSGECTVDARLRGREWKT